MIGWVSDGLGWVGSDGEGEGEGERVEEGRWYGYLCRMRAWCLCGFWGS